MSWPVRPSSSSRLAAAADVLLLANWLRLWLSKKSVLCLCSVCARRPTSAVFSACRGGEG